MPQGKWDINELMEVMKKEIMSRERCVPEENYNHDDGFPEIPNSSAATLYSQGKIKSRYEKKNTMCAFCEKPHNSRLCRTVALVEDRKAIIRRKNKCFVCLKTNHIAKNCYSKRLCNDCQGKHHESICTRKEHSGGENSSVTNRSSLNAVTTNIINDCRNKCILLQTAQAEVFHCDFNNTSLVRLIFDNCSQRSFIKSSLRQKLKLPTVRTELLAVKTFASDIEKMQKLDVVNIKVRSCKNLNITELEVYVVPLICSPVSSQIINVVKESYEFLKDLELADNSDVSCEMEIDILVGANHYWDFVTGRIKRSGNGLTAVNTTLGWVLNGTVNINPAQVQSVNLAMATHVLKIQTDEVSLKNQLEKFWEVENSGQAELETFNIVQLLMEENRLP